MNSKQRAEDFEELYTKYIAKLRRLDDLQVQGRYGYQLRMPRLAVRKAMDALRMWGNSNGVEVETLLY